jgi:hypothetical protein
MNVVKFPYSASRRVYSRRPRVSINGTPEERAAKPTMAASVIELSGRKASKPALPSAMSDDELRVKLACLPHDAREAMIGFVNHILAKCSP